MMTAGAEGGSGNGDYSGAIMGAGVAGMAGGMGLNLAGDLIGARRLRQGYQNIAERERRKRLAIAGEDEKVVAGMEKANPAAVGAAGKMGAMGAALHAADPGMSVLAGTNSAALAKARAKISPQIVIDAQKQGEETALQQIQSQLAEREAHVRTINENAAMEASLDDARLANSQAQSEMLRWGGSMAMQGGEQLLAQGLTMGNRNTGRQPGAPGSKGAKGGGTASTAGMGAALPAGAGMNPLAGTTGAPLGGWDEYVLINGQMVNLGNGRAPAVDPDGGMWQRRASEYAR